MAVWVMDLIINVSLLRQEQEAGGAKSIHTFRSQRPATTFFS
jgi:hypothetical protein